MTAERVNAMLKAYRFEVGRCGHLMAEITAKQRQLEAEYNDTVETLAAPKPQQITDMPRGTAIGNPTERFGLMLADGFKTAMAQELEQQIAALQSEYDERIDTVMHVDSWLKGLPERERWMVETQVIDGVFWKDVASRYRERYHDDASKDTLKRIRDRAMDLIYQMAR